MTSLERLEYYLAKAMAKVSADDLRSVADGVRLTLPEALQTLKGVMTAPETTSAQKLKALEMTLDVWEKVLRADLQEARTSVLKDKAAAKRAEAAAKRIQATAEKQKADNEMDKIKRRIARALSKSKSPKEKE